jgi:uncharacterized protein
MLIQLTIENFLSFRDEVTFSMVGVGSDRQHADRLIEDAAGKGRPVLPIAAIYGANAAGKSNLIKALIFAKDLILEGTRSNRSIPVSTFKLGDYTKKPSKFEFIFTHQDARYSYGFKLNREQILEEWLHAIPSGKKKEVMVFERITSSDRKTTVSYGSLLTGRSAKRKQFIEFVAEGTRPNQLFLTEAIDRNVETLSPIANWFREILTIIMADSIFVSLESTILSDVSFTDFLSKFLKLAGTGIDKVGGGTVELDFDLHLPGMPKIDRDNLLQKFSGAPANSVLMIEDNIGKQYLLLKGDNGLMKMLQLVTQHRHENGKLVDFAITEESEGTQRLINLIPALFVLQEEEKVIFIDELDRRLHPLLSRLFVKAAIDYRGKNNQLIFTTHDTNLLGLDLLRRDEIWFVEKDLEGSSSLYSLAEFKARPDLKIEKGYLNGRFGAIPFVGNLESLGWHDLDSKMEKIEH